MIKLYKTSDGVTNYWETWANDEKSGTIHWGQLGHRGESKIVETNYKKTVKKEVNERLEQGFNFIDDDDLVRLLIEFKVDDMGTADDLDKRNRLQSRMDETLGWTGLGHCDGGSIGSGTMEVCCFVVDFEIAKRIIQDDLADTGFSDYTRIFNEDEE